MNGADPLSAAQERLWFLQRLDPESPAYNVPLALRLTGSVDLASLDTALRATADRHAALRTRFVEIEGGGFQRVDDRSDLSLQVVDLPNRDAARAMQELSRLAARPFDLVQERPIRAYWCRLDGEDSILLLVMHHIITDGWSNGLIVRDLGLFYEAIAEGRELSPGPAALPYVEFVRRERALLSSKRLDELLDYWRRVLRDTPVALPLRTDFPYGSSSAQTGGAITHKLTAGDLLGVDLARRTERVTNFMLYVTLWQALLARQTGSNDVLTGVPVTLRTERDLEETVGCFVNTVALRARRAPEESIREALADTRAATLDAFAHGALPLQRLIDSLRPKRELGRAPLLQVLFVHQRSNRRAFSFGKLSAKRVDILVPATKFELALTVDEDEEFSEVRLDYASNLFTPTSAGRLLSDYVALVQELPTTLDQPAAPPRQHQTAGPDSLSGPAFAASGSASETVVTRFRRTAREFADRTAVQDGSDRLTFRELEAGVDGLVNVLRDRGVGPECRVGICAPRTIGMTKAVLAVLVAGGAYVPLDPLWPAKRIAQIARDSRMLLVLAPEGLHSSLQAAGVTVLNIDASSAGDRRVEPPDPESLAYVLYTSGSTGQPKGVGVEHRQLRWYLDAVCEWLPIREGLSYAMLQPLSVDSSITSLYPPLVTGGRLVLVPEERGADAGWLNTMFATERIDVLKIAPTHLRALHDTLPERRLMPRRYLIVGGEASSAEWLLELQRDHPECTVINHYGPTETTVGITTCRVRDLASGHATTPVGAALPGVSLRILDEKLDAVPRGSPGFLFAAGPAVTRGYVESPVRTAERYVPDSDAGADPGTRMYATGDRVRIGEDGWIEFLGRGDRQVKVRGHRIEPAEVEAALLALPGVNSAVVETRLDDRGELRLVAFVGGRGMNAAELRAALAQQLPTPLVPSHFELMQSLPRTAHGKVDLRALPTPRWHVEQPWAPMDQPVEQAIAAIWGTVLGRIVESADVSFFDLGGTSLGAMRVLSLVASRYGLNLPLRAVFEHQTIRSLAAHVAGLGAEMHDHSWPDAAATRGEQ